jgi:hypothetical protein
MFAVYNSSPIHWNDTMILVLQKADDPDDFGTAISAIQVSAKEWEWDGTDFLVRISGIE